MDRPNAFFRPLALLLLTPPLLAPLLLLESLGAHLESHEASWAVLGRTETLLGPLGSAGTPLADADCSWLLLLALLLLAPLVPGLLLLVLLLLGRSNEQRLASDVQERVRDGQPEELALAV